MKARIYKDGLVWWLIVPGIGKATGYSAAEIMEKWFSFLRWAK